MGFKETNYGKFTDTENQDYKIVKESLKVMDSL